MSWPKENGLKCAQTGSLARFNALFVLDVDFQSTSNCKDDFVKNEPRHKNSFSLESQTDWERLDAMTDDDIDFSDIPELTAEQLQAMEPAREFFAERGISLDPTPPHTVTVYHEDGRTTTHLLAPAGHTIVLDADVQSFFPDSESVNHVLRSLIALIPRQQTNSAATKAK